MSPIVITNVGQLISHTLIVLIRKEFPNLLLRSTMIDNDPRKSIRYIPRDMGVSKFLISQIVHEDIRYFSYKMRKTFFITSYEGQEEKPRNKAFEQTQVSTPTEIALLFIRRGKFQDLLAGAGLDSWCKTGSCWIGGHRCWTGSRCFRTGSCCCRKMVAGAGLTAAGASLVVRTGGHWCRTGSCYCRTGSCWCRKVVAGSGVVTAGAERWSLVQDW